MIEVGKKAPDFKLTGSDGKVYRLKDFSGSKLILYFYPKDDTPGCTIEACDFRDNLKIFEKNNFTIVGVSADDEVSHKKFIDKYNLNFLLLSDVDKTTINKYGVWREKNKFGKVYFGIVRTTFVIDKNGILENIYNNVVAKEHIQNILKDFENK